MDNVQIARHCLDDNRLKLWQVGFSGFLKLDQILDTRYRLVRRAT
jgi:hypothetical protein